MRLHVRWVDMRGGYMGPQAWRSQVIDQDTGQIVGWVHSERSPAFRHICLFGAKYQAAFSSNNSTVECEAFAKGVEAVFNNALAIGEHEIESEVAA
jgi:hypothetical protein